MCLVIMDSSFYVVLGALVQDGLMSKENIHEVLKKCRILCECLVVLLKTLQY